MDKDKRIALEDKQRREAIANQIERRVIPFTFELRDAGDGAAPKIVGHAAVFNQPCDMGYFTETMLPGAFTETIMQDDIRALFNHDPNMILGRNTAGTLSLSQDATGLAMEITPGDRSYELDLMKSIKRGDISQASIGFQTLERTIRETPDMLYRDITKVKLWDVSPVTFPAYESTNVSMRSSLQAILETEFRRGPEGQTEPTEERAPDWELDLERRRRMLELVRN